MVGAWAACLLATAAAGGAIVVDGLSLSSASHGAFVAPSPLGQRRDVGATRSPLALRAPLGLAHPAMEPRGGRMGKAGLQMTASPPREKSATALTGADLPSLYTESGRFDQDKAYGGGLQNIHALWDIMASVCGDYVALKDPHYAVQMTYAEVAEKIERLAGQLQGLGIAKGDRLAVFSENSHRWLLLDGATLKCGAANVVRGATAPMDELVYIYSNSDSKACAVQTPELLAKLADREYGILAPSVTHKPEFFLVIDPEGKSGAELAAAAGIDPSGPQVVTLDELLAPRPENMHKYSHVDVDKSDTATLLYTSGTTGRPKGVVLSHGNLEHQIIKNGFSVAEPYDPVPGDVQLSILPCWHIFERAAEYYAFARGVTIVYSSVRTFKADLAEYRPHFLIAVPRLFENIHDGVLQKFAKESVVKRTIIGLFTLVGVTVMKHKRALENRLLVSQARQNAYLNRPAPVKAAQKLLSLVVVALLGAVGRVGDKLVWAKVREGLGGRMKCLVSGGSLLSQKVDDFFELAGQKVIVGYGLTETSPVICNRITERNIAGACGTPPALTEIKILDVETRAEYGRMAGAGVSNAKVVPSAGQVGVIWARGPQITCGYYKRDDATKEAFDDEGFFCTGDLGRIDPVTGELIITGRAKDTIVLSNGENVEPTPLEDAITESRLVDQVMLVGNDERFLAALVVVSLGGLLQAGLIPKEKFDSLAPLVPEIRDPTPDAALLAREGRELSRDTAVKAAVLGSIKKLVNQGTGFREWEAIKDVHLLLEPFTVGNAQMTQTLKVKRDVVAKIYETEINHMYGK